MKHRRKTPRKIRRLIAMDGYGYPKHLKIYYMAKRKPCKKK